MLIPSLRGSVKVANAPYPGFHSVATQQYAPIQGAREFSPEEEEEIAAGKSRWFPKIFKSYSTPASQLMSSPGKGALMAGGVGALGGGLLGAALGGASQPPGNASGGVSPAVGAGVGALGLGGLAALIAYFKRKQNNENVEELMSRLPPHATRRDMLSDPAYQKDREMNQTQGMNAALIAALASR